MSDARRKERKRLKREKKRSEIRKVQSISPYQRLSQGDVVECCINVDWRDRGQVAGFVLRQGPDGKLGMATFFVDTWCAGLKDIWGSLDIVREDFDHAIDMMDEQMDGAMEACTLEELAGVLAAGIRFAQRNNFKLPPHYQRWAALFGKIDPTNADLADFGWEDGKLHWVGPLFDLQRRYLGRVEDFLAREDVESTIGLDDNPWDEGYLDDDGEDEDEDVDVVLLEDLLEQAGQVSEIVERMSDAAEQWCRETNIVPSPLIALAMTMKLTFTFVNLGEATPEDVEEYESSIAQMMHSLGVGERSDLSLAQQQIDQFFDAKKKDRLASPQDALLPQPSAPAPTPAEETLPE